MEIKQIIEQLKEIKEEFPNLEQDTIIKLLELKILMELCSKL